MTITIRRATLEDKPAIFAFLDLAYGEKGKYKYPKRWEWQFEHNPFRDPELIPLWIAIDESAGIVGQIGSQIEPLKVFDLTNRRLYWGVDLVVLPEFQNQKIGKKLNQAMTAETKNIIALPMSGAYRHYLTQMGANGVDITEVFRKPIKHKSSNISAYFRIRLERLPAGNFLLDLIHFLKLPSILASIGNWALKLKHSKGNIPSNSGLSIAEVDNFDAAFDILWLTVKDEFEIIVERTSKFLNWKYIQQPFLDYKIFTARRDGSVAGYIIIKCADPHEGDFGVIADLFCSPNDRECMDALIEHAITWFTTQEVSVALAASSHPVFQNGFREHKFSKIKEILPLFKNLELDTEAECPYETGHWFFSRSDHDWDQPFYG